MKYSVEFVPGAKQDIFKIYRYIKNSGRPEAAKQLSAQLTELCASLAENPHRCHLPAELEGLSTRLCRQVVLKNYRVVYQIIGKAVVIHGIIDGRRSIREVMAQRVMS